jgi:meiotically up-regulated gene 157 (Mug157) protein
MVWSGFRPSDDSCWFGYLVPANMFAAVILGWVREFARTDFADEELAQAAEKLEAEIRFGIETYGIVQHPTHGQIYAYETDGFGNFNLMDDANVPSLLAMPYLGFCTPDDALYRNTRAFVLSSDNPYFFSGRFASGIGSPHTDPGYVWHIGITMQGLTSTDPAEQERLIDMLVATTADTNFMHESFDPNDPAQYSRSWFAWANSLFAEFVLRWLETPSG